MSASPGCGDVQPERGLAPREPQAQAAADVDDGGSSRGRDDLRCVDEGGHAQSGHSKGGEGSLRLYASGQKPTPKGGTFDHATVEERVSSQ